MTANQQHGRGNIGRNYYVVIGPKLHHPEIAPGAAYLRALHLQPPPDRAQNADRIARHISDTTSVRPPWSHLPWRLGPPHLAFQEHRFVRRTVLPPDSAKPPCVCVAQIFICASPWYDCPYRSHTWNGFSFWPTFHHHHHTTNTHTSTSTVLRASFFFSPLWPVSFAHERVPRSLCCRVGLPVAPEHEKQQQQFGVPRKIHSTVPEDSKDTGSWQTLFGRQPQQSTGQDAPAIISEIVFRFRGL